MSSSSTSKIASIAAAEEIRKIADSMARLRSLGVIRSQKLVSDLGEWIVAKLFGGCLAESKTQQDWDVRCDSGRVQVRSHAKAADNFNQWTPVSRNYDRYEELVIVVLSEVFLVRHVYRVPASEVALRVVKGQLRWASIQEFEINPRELPGYEELAPIFENSLSP